jgi:hypothetical protein
MTCISERELIQKQSILRKLDNSKLVAYFGVLISSLFICTPTLALEQLDDVVLSKVTGQAQGLKYTSEFGISIQSIDYFDDDPGDLGSLAFSEVSIETAVNRPLVIDVEVGIDPGDPTRRGLFLSANDLAIEYKIANIYVNNESLGGFGGDNFQMDAGDQYVSRFYAGGRNGDGLSIDMVIPASMTSDQYYEDSGVRLTTSIGFSQPDPLGTGKIGGMTLRNLTLDIEKDGVMIGLPEITDGAINFYNFRLGDQILNSVALRHINLLPGGELYIKPSKDVGSRGLEADALIKQGSNLDFVYISGSIDGQYPDENTFEMAGNVNFETDFEVNGLTVNVSKENGIELAFNETFVADENDAIDRDITLTSGLIGNGARGEIKLSDVYLYRSDVAVIPSSATHVGAGVLQARIHVLPTSYIHVRGH